MPWPIVKWRLQAHTVDVFLVAVIAGIAAHQRARFWLSWRRVLRELRRLKVGQS